MCIQNVALPTRREKVLSGLNMSGHGLEIGPSYSPLVPKAEGYDVRSVDHLDRVGLVEKYKGMNVDISRIEDVDYVWSGERISSLVNGEKFDWVIASHVIEHVPDMITFLRDCAEVLKDDGVLSLIVPDKRYEFDYFRPTTGIGKVIDAFHSNQVRPSAGTVAEFCLYMANKDGREVWDRLRFGSDPDFVGTVDDARRMQDLAFAGEYRDCHVWTFTPSSFRLMALDLHGLGFITLQETGFFDTEGFEFYIQLSKDEPVRTLNRRELALGAVKEFI